MFMFVGLVAAAMCPVYVLVWVLCLLVVTLLFWVCRFVFYRFGV